MPEPSHSRKLSKKAPRLVACDLDGTLLRSDGKGLDVAAEAVRYCKSKGVFFTIATGRLFGALEKYLHLFDISGPAIANGGAIVASAGKAPILERTIAQGTARTIAGDLRRDRLPFYFVERDRMLTEWTGPETAQYSANISYPIQIVGPDEYLPCEPTQIAVRVPPLDAAQYVESFRVRGYPGVAVLHSLPHLIEFQAEGVSKAAALSVLAAHLGIERKDVMAIGDSLNDLDMLAWAGLSACVGNARPEVASIAEVRAEKPFGEGVLEILKKTI